MKKRNLRPVGFNVVALPGATEFFFFGPLQPGEAVRGLSYLLGNISATGETVFVEIAVFSERPSVDGSDFSNGDFLTADPGTGVGFLMPRDSDAVVGFVPFEVVGGDFERFIGVRLDNSGAPANAVRGNIFFDLVSV